MTQLLNEYLNRKQIIDSLIPDSQWKEMRGNYGIYTIIRIVNQTVYYRYSQNSIHYEWECDLNIFLKYATQHCEKI